MTVGKGIKKEELGSGWMKEEKSSELQRPKQWTAGG
jgi:hypothetical protein